MRETAWNAKLFHNDLKCLAACHEAVFLPEAANDSVLGGDSKIGKSACFRPGAAVSGPRAEKRLVATTPRKTGNGWAILNSGFGLCIKRK